MPLPRFLSTGASSTLVTTGTTPASATAATGCAYPRVLGSRAHVHAWGRGNYRYPSPLWGGGDLLLPVGFRNFEARRCLQYWVAFYCQAVPSVDSNGCDVMGVPCWA